MDMEPKIHSSVGKNTNDYKERNNPFPLLLKPPQILKTRVHLQFWKVCGWPILLLIDHR